jgi:hypothetical protein
MSAKLQLKLNHFPYLLSISCCGNAPASLFLQPIMLKFKSMRFKIIYTLFALAGLAFLFFNNSSGAAEVQGIDRTGSPISPGPCQNCHSSGSFSPSVNLDILKDGEVVQTYMPGEVYTMRVTANHSGSPASFGFQAVALTGEDDVQAGAFDNPGDGIQITSLNNRQYPEHSRRNESNIFEVEWTAPAAGTGDVRFYSSVVAANNGSGSGGDGSAFLNNPVVISEATTNSQDVTKLLAEFNAFPNPVSDRLQLQWQGEESGDYRIEVYDINGRLVQQQPQQVAPGQQSATIEVSNMPAGLYQVRITDGQRQNIQRFIKR